MTWCPGTSYEKGFCSINGCGADAMSSSISECNLGSSPCQNECKLTWCTGSIPTPQPTPSPTEERVYESICLDFENCQCSGGHCDMPNCYSNCLCPGGTCNMPSCFFNCSCQGGDCSMPTCFSDCTSGSIGLHYPISPTGTILSIILAVIYLMA